MALYPGPVPKGPVVTVGFGNPAAERAAIERTYEDTATVIRVRPATGIDHITRNEPVTVCEAAPCGLSQTGVAGSGQAPAQNKVECDGVLFLAPEWPIKPGDRVEVQRLGAVLAFEAVGRPAVFATHQEITLRERGMT